MDDKPPKPPWDGSRATFYLIASILAFHCFSVLVVFMTCVYYLHDLLGEGKAVCDKDNKLTELLTGALAAALAFAGGNRTK